MKQRRCADEIWSDQVDAAAVVGAEAKVDGGGRARVLGRREVEDTDEEAEGESERAPGPIYKARG